jgi:hypothetical protein
VIALANAADGAQSATIGHAYQAECKRNLYFIWFLH